MADQLGGELPPGPVYHNPFLAALSFALKHVLLTISRKLETGSTVGS